MPYFLGIDGGGSKTDCLLVDGWGQSLAAASGGGSSYRQHGKDSVVKNLKELSGQCLRKAGLSLEQINGVCIGLPLFDENAANDAYMSSAIQAIFPQNIIVNDVRAGWAGSLACQPGINVVAGTGSIAFGRDGAGHTARSGGWSEFFSDEGSAYWVAMRGMGLFTKQADGRVPKGALYRLIKETHHLDNDFDFVSLAESQLLPRRDKTAAFQRIVAEAGKAGDTSVLCIYQEAALELSSLALAVKKRLGFDGEKVTVSYSGGMFRVGEMLLKPFEKFLFAQGMCLRKPLLSPVKGAVLLAVEHFATDLFGQVLGGLE